MNILIIGNGFDIAHGLPTKYVDFLEFVKVIKQISNTKKLNEVNWGSIHPEVKYIIEKNTGNIRNNLFSQSVMWSDLLDDNIWIDYFLQNDMHGKENWIDFESEISDVIKSLDYDIHGEGNDFDLYDEIMKNLSNEYLDCHEQLRELESFKELRDRLYEDLNKLIRALELYLTEYVSQIECKIISPDISKIIMKIIEHEDGTKGATTSKIVCFNYTDTLERVYKYCRTEDIDYIHGKAVIDNTIETNNMVLGIDEFLPVDRQNIHTEFVAFKKFYQRIYKQTGCKYKEWVDKIREDYYSYLQKQTKEINRGENGIQDSLNGLPESVLRDQKCKRHNLYIFGHSLDVTDKDILRDLILNDNVYTTIFYHNKDAMGQLITNLVKIIGEEELIKRTGGRTKTIEFKQQQAMILNEAGYQ